jgi:multiple sugar transport system permease protein
LVGVRAKAKSAGIWLGLTLAMVWVVFPLYWAVLQSFKPQGNLYGSGIIPFLQFQPTLDNWHDELADWIGYAGQVTAVRGLINSTVVATSTAIICVILGALAAYGLAHFSRGEKFRVGLLSTFLLPRLLPPAVLIIPVLLFARAFGAADTTWGLVLFDVPVMLPFAVLILHDSFRQVPRDLEEAAVVDGCGWWGMLRHVALPLVLPAVLPNANNCYAYACNELNFSKTLYQQKTTTVSMEVSALQSLDGPEMQGVGVILVLALLPPTLLSFLAQRYVVRGLTFGLVRE